MTDGEDRDGRAAREQHALAGRTVVLSGGVQGVGGALAVGLGRAGANVVLLTRPARGAVTPDLLRVVDEVDASGGRSMVVAADVRDELAVARAVAEAAARFGGIDVCINNASALSLAGTEAVPVSSFDLMLQVNVRGAFVLTRVCLPYLRSSDNAHILTISPPINMAPRWLGDHPPYTLSKYGMTILALGWAAEFAGVPIASNCLWPERAISTGSAVSILGEDAERWSRRPEVMADAAVSVLSSPAHEMSGQCLLDADVLLGSGLTDLQGYGGENSQTDLFVGG
ncbi:MAG: SDR family oxidoreductase [Propionibacteriales bacterium]|nr:SDR family oxidoreductase [Propionibacteriales bacterium]